MNSVIGKAKKSVDSTVDAYMGRAAFAICILGAAIFALAGLWIVLVQRFGTTVACFGLAAILLLVSLLVRASVVAREQAAERDIEDVEKTIEDTGLAGFAGFPFDLSTALTVLPLLAPLLKSLRSVLPYLLVAGLAAGYVMSSSADRKVQDPSHA